jgi:hypothetical protein
VVNKFNKSKPCLSSQTRDGILQDAFLPRSVNIIRLERVCLMFVNVLIEILGVTVIADFGRALNKENVMS